MEAKSSSAFIRSIDVSPNHAQFYPQVFQAISHRERSYRDELEALCANDYADLTLLLDRAMIQEGCSVRNVLRTRKLADFLITDNGDLHLQNLEKAIHYFTKYLYSLAPNSQHDSVRQENILRMLRILHADKDLQRQIKSIGRPIQHKYAEEILRDTLRLPYNAPLTDAHARRAALSALLCTLRQSVGSCFATAPAIIVHDEQPKLFLQDINELINTGRLKRTFGGIEYTVPLSPSWGVGDLKKFFRLPRYLMQRESFEIWLSPGLIHALETVKVLRVDATYEVMAEELKRLIAEVLLEYPGEDETVLTCAEDLLKKILLKKNGIQESELENYLNRPQQMVQSLMLIEASHTGGRVSEACRAFLEQFDLAKKAFRSIVDNALLKAWEFSVASFAETKADFARWNLYSSLGLGANEPGGIGKQLYRIIQHKLDIYNNKVQALQVEYEQVFTQLKYLESRIKNASTEKEAQWIRAEYQSRLNEFYTLEEIRDTANQKARSIASAFEVLVDLYDSLFPKYFQEVYDADMQGIEVGQYDDSPAGFRLLYKHGRSNTSQWTMVQNANEFIQALSSFFIATEPEIASDPRLDPLKDDIGEIVTQIISHIRTQEFLETAFNRMADAHQTPKVKNPLQNLDKVAKKPWAYTSGGTMDGLINNYFRLDQKPFETARWVENEAELLTFMQDTLKLIPYKISQDFLQKTYRSLLMHSPTHAFLLKPAKKPFREGWTNDGYTYTWIRDNLIIPRQKFVSNMKLNHEVMEAIIDNVCANIPYQFRSYLKKAFVPSRQQLSPTEFRKQLVCLMNKDKMLKPIINMYFNVDQIDSLLYETLPYTSALHLYENASKIFEKIHFLESEQRDVAQEFIRNASDALPSSVYLSAKRLRELTLAAIIWATQKTVYPIDIHLEVANAVQDLGLAFPAPLIFADTNWVKDYFAFVVNPGTGNMDFWVVDCTGTHGAPMSQWRMWLNGSRRERTWGIYSRPHEYTG